MVGGGGVSSSTRKRDSTCRLGIARPDRVPLGDLAEHVYSRPCFWPTSTTFHSHHLPVCPGPPFKHSLYPTDSSQLPRPGQILYLLQAPRFRCPSPVKYTYTPALLLRPSHYLVCLVHFKSSLLRQPPRNYTHIHRQEIYILLSHATAFRSLDRNALCHGIRRK